MEFEPVGGRWWRFDLHTHSPASDDYGKSNHELKTIEPREWLLNFMRAEIDCVAVTDHNSAAWVDKLTKALHDLDVEKPKNYRPLTLFPGMEIGVNGGAHLLAIFAPGTKERKIQDVLARTKYPGEPGATSQTTHTSFIETVSLIADAGGLPIPAHVDIDTGLFKRLTGATLAPILDSPKIHAMETTKPDYTPPGLFQQKKPKWVDIVGSDSHFPDKTGPSYPGSKFTWIKMDAPSLEGLQLALSDGKLSVYRSDTQGQPPAAPALQISGVEIRSGKIAGTKDPLEIKFSPWLTTIIGGRGGGKSTIIESMRLALGREDMLPPALMADLSHYYEVAKKTREPGLLTPNTKITLEYRKDSTFHRLIWSADSQKVRVERLENNKWIPLAGDVRQLFPVRIFSQKEIFELAKATSGILSFIDEAGEVRGKDLQHSMKSIAADFKATKARTRSLQTQVAQEPELKGRLDDIDRRIKEFEKAGFADALEEYQRRRKQEDAIKQMTASWEEAGNAFSLSVSKLEVAEIEYDAFDADEDKGLLDIVSKARENLSVVASEAGEIAKKWDQERDTTDKIIGESPWKNTVQQAYKRYEQLQEGDDGENAFDKQEFENLLSERSEITKALGEIAEAKEKMQSQVEQAKAHLDRHAEERRELTVRRTTFVNESLKKNANVRIRVHEMADHIQAMLSLRQVFGKEVEFSEDFGDTGGGLVKSLFQISKKAGPKPTKLKQCKDDLLSLASGSASNYQPEKKAFANMLQKASPDQLDDMELWYPDDLLIVEYSPQGDGKNFQAIEDASPGQRTAALLAFILSRGKRPLILDQPEDDLDNRLVSDLIVDLLRKQKVARQVIVVTHNPNIVVNGDAEYVVAVEATKKGVKQHSAGGLQSKVVRAAVCNIMEGGETALRQRFERILNLG